MTPKDKAEELFSHYNLILIDEIRHAGARNYAAYKCSLIAVDEILNEYWSHDTKRRDWWQKVKKEIEKI